MLRYSFELFKESDVWEDLWSIRAHSRTPIHSFLSFSRFFHSSKLKYSLCVERSIGGGVSCIDHIYWSTVFLGSYGLLYFSLYVVVIILEFFLTSIFWLIFWIGVECHGNYILCSLLKTDLHALETLWSHSLIYFSILCSLLWIFCACHDLQKLRIQIGTSSRQE